MIYNWHKKYALFIGRWQPFHNGHKYLIDKAINEGKDVCIAIRETEISEKNPYSVDQRMEMVKRVYGNKIRLISVPDIESINIGRKVGYDINRIDPPEDITVISGTNIRSGKDDRIPPVVNEYLKSLNTTVWFTGLPCSGKTTLAKRLKEELDNRGYKTALLDGDDVRDKLNEDLSFSDRDRFENLRRIAHVAKLFNENGNFVIASFISPTNKMREMVKKIIPTIKIIYLQCSLETCEKRDTRGMYKQAREGKIKDFTGIGAPFEIPKTDLVVDTEKKRINACIEQILAMLNIK